MNFFSSIGTGEKQNRIFRSVSYYTKRQLSRYPRLYIQVYQLAQLFRQLLIKFKFYNVYNESSNKYISKDLGLVSISLNNSKKYFEPLPPYSSSYEIDQDFSGHSTDIKAIAYYLPQFHAIPENDKWWGKGFTEWSNTRKAKPLFPGHYQPREPHQDIGYYDLNDINVIKNQVNLAKKHGIYGFCFYHYWFHGKRLLGKPVDLILNNPEIDMPFCLCWANETWSKKWDGRDHHILIKQKFSPEDDFNFIKFLEPYFKDPRYIRIDGRPVLMVYRISKLPNPLETANRWQNWANNNGVGQLYLLSAYHGDVFPHKRLKDIGFDAYAAFPPHKFDCVKLSADKNVFGTGHRCDYQSGVDSYSVPKIDTPVYEGCTLGWDNTPRFSENATIYLNFSSKHYYEWLRKAISNTRSKFSSENRFIFINAWNEWAEGTYLEPDKKYGYSNINTTSKALFDIPFEETHFNTELNFNASSAHYTRDYNLLKEHIKSNADTSLAAISRLIDNNSTILEFGPSSGYFTRFLKEEKDAIVDIVEIDPYCAEIASNYARDCSIGDIEDFLWKDQFSHKNYDIILFPDVLEHLRDPWNALYQATDLLKPSGKILLSVPNIAHVQILASLYNNDFSYTKNGILDKSHLRFFTEQTIRQMISDCHLKICNFIPIQSIILPGGLNQKLNSYKLPKRLRAMISQKEHAYTLQFIICCEKKKIGI